MVGNFPRSIFPNRWSCWRWELRPLRSGKHGSWAHRSPVSNIQSNWFACGRSVVKQRIVISPTICCTQKLEVEKNWWRQDDLESGQTHLFFFIAFLCEEEFLLIVNLKFWTFWSEHWDIFAIELIFSEKQTC